MSRIYANDFSPTVTTYYKELGKYAPIEKDEEIELIKRAKNGDINAQNKILESNLRFVFNIAKRYKGMGVPLLDLISEGNLGLMKAIERFDPNKNNKFITYAIWWVKESIKQFIKDNTSECTVDCVTYENKVENNPDNQITDEASSDKEHKDEVISKLLSKLNDREKRIIEKYYGLNGEDEKNLEEIGKELGLTKERVRKIKWSALQKMRSEILIIEGADLIFN